MVKIRNDQGTKCFCQGTKWLRYEMTIIGGFKHNLVDKESLSRDLFVKYVTKDDKHVRFLTGVKIFDIMTDRGFTIRDLSTDKFSIG